jgi:hypothetical protein
VERAAAGGAGRGTSAIDADGQAHQCRFSLGILDAARQHHDARTGHGDGVCPAHAGIVIERAIAGTAPDAGSSRRGGGQEAACAETSTHRRAGSDFAGSGRTGTRGASAGARGIKRLMLSKADAER